ncbi:MAG: metallophosphoesterase [Gemmataceae bacterium]
MCPSPRPTAGKNAVGVGAGFRAAYNEEVPPITFLTHTPPRMNLHLPHLDFYPRSLRNWTHLLGRTWGRVSYGFHVEPTWLEVNRLDIPVRGLPPGFDGFRIVQLSDLHCGWQMPLEHIRNSVAVANAEKADLAVITGDFVHKGYKHVAASAEAVAGLRAEHGVYAVLGNHDFSVRNALGVRRYRDLHQTIADALAAKNLRVLRNEYVQLRRGDAALYLAGVEDLWSRACDLGRALDGLPEDAPRVVMAHNPQTVELLHGRRCDLMLSGHTHGGQIDWPGVGRLFLDKGGRRFAAGLYRHDQTHLYVNKGVGYGWRFRFRVRPEVAVFTLRAA